MPHKHVEDDSWLVLGDGGNGEVLLFKPWDPLDIEATVKDIAGAFAPRWALDAEP